MKKFVCMVIGVVLSVSLLVGCAAKTIQKTDPNAIEPYAARTFKTPQTK